MIAFLRGRLVEAQPTAVTIDVNGVGYEVLIPLSSFDRLPTAGHEIKLLTHLAVREDAHTLYGFMTSPERDLFRLLIHTVSGIGPKLALNVLSGIQVSAFVAAIAAGDVKLLSGISGVGRKTAERMVMELKDKLGAFGPAPAPGHGPASSLPTGSGSDSRLGDATAALVALGYKPADALQSVRASLALLGDHATVEQLIRACLKKGA